MPLTGHPYANRLHAKETVQPLFIGCTDLLSKVSPMRADHRSAPTALRTYAPYPSVEGSVAWRVYRATWRSASLGKPLRIQLGRLTPNRTNNPGLRRGVPVGTPAPERLWYDRNARRMRPNVFSTFKKSAPARADFLLLRMTYDEVTAPDSLLHQMVLPDTHPCAFLWPGPGLPPGPGWPTGSAGPRCC